MFSIHSARALALAGGKGNINIDSMFYNVHTGLKLLIIFHKQLTKLKINTNLV